MENQPPVNAGEGEKKKHEHNETSTTASKDQNTVKAADSGSDPSTTITPSAPAAEQKRKKPENVGDGNDDAEEDSDFDELDDVLDDFSKPQPTSTGPDRPDTAKSQQAPSTKDYDESAFMTQLEQEMATMMEQAAKESGVSDGEGFESAVDKGAEEFAKKLEESGIPPGDFLKQLLADVMAEEGGGGFEDSDFRSTTAATTTTTTTTTQGPSTSSTTASAAASASATAARQPPPESFNDAIQRTINRMQESGDKATAAAAEKDMPDDVVIQLLQALASGEGDECELTSIISSMMEQLSNKEMLYEPMKELDTKFGPWIAENKSKVSKEDLARYEKQANYVSEIVAKFDEKGYKDDDPKCREYIWERMQAMQAAGSPPEDLIANPWNPILDDAAAGKVPECPTQ